MASRVTEELILGMEGFTYGDLYDPERLKDLAVLFYKEVDKKDPELGKRYAAYRDSKGEGLSEKDISNIIIELAAYLDPFVSHLFQIDLATEKDRQSAQYEQPIFDFRRNFVMKRALKAFKPEEAAIFDLDWLDRAMDLLVEIVNGPGEIQKDKELSYARAISELLNIEKELVRKVKGIQEIDGETPRKRLVEICDGIRKNVMAASMFGDQVPPPR